MGWGGQFDNVIRSFEELEDGRWYANTQDLAEVQRLLAEAVRELEFSIRRELGTGQREGPATAGTGAVPQQYREAVDEYFRTLANPE
jgi:hypothetical protein